MKGLLATLIIVISTLGNAQVADLFKGSDTLPTAAAFPKSAVVECDTNDRENPIGGYSDTYRSAVLDATVAQKLLEHRFGVSTGDRANLNEIARREEFKPYERWFKQADRLQEGTMEMANWRFEIISYYKYLGTGGGALGIQGAGVIAGNTHTSEAGFMLVGTNLVSQRQELILRSYEKYTSKNLEVLDVGGLANRLRLPGFVYLNLDNQQDPAQRNASVTTAKAWDKLMRKLDAFLDSPAR